MPSLMSLLKLRAQPQGAPQKTQRPRTNTSKMVIFWSKMTPPEKCQKQLLSLITFIDQKRFKNAPKRIFSTNLTHFHHPIDIFGDLPDDHFPIKIQKFRKKPEKKIMFKNDRKTPKKSNSAKKKQRFR